MVPPCQLPRQPPLGRSQITPVVGAPRSTPDALSWSYLPRIDSSPDAWVLPNQSVK
jgi:hypothetical protein